MVKNWLFRIPVHIFTDRGQRSRPIGRIFDVRVLTDCLSKRSSWIWPRNVGELILKGHCVCRKMGETYAIFALTNSHHHKSKFYVWSLKRPRKIIRASHNKYSVLQDRHGGFLHYTWKDNSCFQFWSWIMDPFWDKVLKRINKTIVIVYSMKNV